MFFFKKLHIKNSHKLLSWSLFSGAIYFFLISMAHIFNFKIPILFIYFSVPSYIYQDNIIAFLSFGFGMFLYAGYASVKKDQLIIVKYILIASAGILLGLANINFFTDFSTFEKEFSLTIKVSHFWNEFVIVIIYILWILLLYVAAIKGKKYKIEETAKKEISEVLHDEQKEFLKYR